MYCFYYQLFINRLFAFCKTRYPLLPVIVFNQPYLIPDRRRPLTEIRTFRPLH